MSRAIDKEADTSISKTCCRSIGQIPSELFLADKTSGGLWGAATTPVVGRWDFGKSANDVLKVMIGKFLCLLAMLGVSTSVSNPKRGRNQGRRMMRTACYVILNNGLGAKPMYMLFSRRYDKWYYAHFALPLLNGCYASWTGLLWKPRIIILSTCPI